MGSENVDSDTINLPLASPLQRGRAHGNARARAVGALFALALAIGCNPGAPAPAPASIESDLARADAISAGKAPMPLRAEVVALSDAIAISAQKAGSTAEGAARARKAADLRRRLFRADASLTDAREAIELYAASARAANGAEEGCEADLARALLAGEIARDAAASYRELYLARRRNAASGRAPSCTASIERALALAVAFRPSGDVLRALEKEGDLTAEIAVKAGPSGEVSAPPAPSASSSGSGAPSSQPILAPLSSTEVVVSPPEESTGPTSITAIEPVGGDEAARVVVRMTKPAAFHVGVLEAEEGKGPRIYVDLARAARKGVAREIPVGGLLQRVRTGAQKGGTRVVLDLSKTAFRRVFYLPDPFRVVIDVSARKRTVEHKPGAPREVRRVAIDPGHGGNDAGAIGPTGLKEKDVTLDIAHKVAPLLAHELGIETLLTRDTDVFVPLDLRAARANAFHADLFVSIHCNASENGSARGTQSFVLDEARDADGYAARVAARENAQKGKPEGIDALLGSLRAGDNLPLSRHLAELIQRAALGSLAPRWPDTKDQGVKTAGFFVLVGADMPAVLFETAFISNPDEESRLGTAGYRQKLADAIANAIKAYKEGK